MERIPTTSTIDPDSQAIGLLAITPDSPGYAYVQQVLTGRSTHTQRTIRLSGRTSRASSYEAGGQWITKAGAPFPLAKLVNTRNVSLPGFCGDITIAKQLIRFKRIYMINIYIYNYIYIHHIYIYIHIYMIYTIYNVSTSWAFLNQLTLNIIRLNHLRSALRWDSCCGGLLFLPCPHNSPKMPCTMQGICREYG